MDSFAVADSIIKRSIVPKTNKGITNNMIDRYVPQYTRANALSIGYVVRTLDFQKQDSCIVSEPEDFEPTNIGADHYFSKKTKLNIRPRKSSITSTPRRIRRGTTIGDPIRKNSNLRASFSRKMTTKGPSNFSLGEKSPVKKSEV